MAARLISILMLLCIFGLTLAGWLGTQTLEASASDSAGHSGIEQQTNYRPWLDEHASTPDELLTKVSQGLEDNEAAVTAKGASGVQAGRPLRLQISVFDENGMPAANAKVVVAWRDQNEKSVFTRYTDKDGTTSLTRWIGADEAGHVHVCIVWAGTSEWTGSDYVWFVPE
jgi:protocatechuate 3,4-dioxygenase beta subunit